MLLSIITINFNNKDGLNRTLDSVFSQTFPSFEYIVIDGGSTDGSTALLQQHSQKFSHWVSEPDRGIYHAMNKGMAAAKGEYLLFLNSGDWLSDAHSLGNFFAEPANADIISADINVVDGEKSFIKRYPEKIRFSYLVTDSLPHPATLIRRKLFDKVGPYDESLKIASDWKFFILALCKYNASYEHKLFVATNYDYTGISSKPNNQSFLLAERHDILSEFFPLHIQDGESIKVLNRIRKKSKKSLIIKFFISLGFLKWLKDI